MIKDVDKDNRHVVTNMEYKIKLDRLYSEYSMLYKEYLKARKMLDIIKEHTRMDNVEDDFPDFSIMFTEDELSACKQLKDWLLDE